MPLGSAFNPLSPAQLQRKFLRCAVPVLGSSDAHVLLERLEHLERLPRVRQLLPSLKSVEPDAS
jgi:hypothetical protein